MNDGPASGPTRAQLQSCNNATLDHNNRAAVPVWTVGEQPAIKLSLP